MDNIASTTRFHPRYQSRSSMYIRGLISRNFAELAEAVPIEPDQEITVYLVCLLVYEPKFYIQFLITLKPCPINFTSGHDP